jgi:pilus assembly protein CpaC
VQYKEYGVILEVRPRAGSDGAIYAGIDIELSQLDSSTRVGDFPGFIKRQTSTAINSIEGDTIVIAGMVLREHGRDRSAVPGLGALPLAGVLFRSQRQLHRETELLVLITPVRFESGVSSPQTVPDQPALLERAEILQQGAQANE